MSESTTLEIADKKMMNQNEHNNASMPDETTGSRLDRYFESASAGEVDTTGMMSALQMKMLRERLERSRRNWRLSAIAAVACCVAIISGVYVVPKISLSGTMEESPIAEATHDIPCTELEVPAGETMTIMLPDGTKAIAAARSRLRYPSNFQGTERKVWANGDVYFEVVKDSVHPFVVSCGTFDVTVLGTKFSISSRDRAAASIVLVEGSVAVSTESKENIKMRPNHKLDIRDGAVHEMKVVDAERYTAWTRGMFNLEDQTLRNITDQLSAYYGININLDPKLDNERIYGSLDMKADVEGVFKVISSIIPINVEKLPGESNYRITPKQN